MSEFKQNDSHDWLGDCAQSYVAYLFSSADYEVFGAGKWAADLAVRKSGGNQWFRIEVKSTDRDKKPVRPSLVNLKKKAEVLVEVWLKKNALETRFTCLAGNFDSKKNPTSSELQQLLEKNYA